MTTADAFKFDSVVIGGGAAGLFCAGVAGQRGLRVLVIDHSAKVAEKIRISGGGRANFTNRELDVHSPERHFVSSNPRFCRSALSRYTPQQFIGLVQRYGIAFHEKHKGQLFCDRSADDLIQMLLAECGSSGNVSRWQPCRVGSVRTTAGLGSRFEVETDRGKVYAQNLVIATGGLSIPKIGATDFGYRIAEQFGHSLVPTRPALVPLTFEGEVFGPFADLAGLALPMQIATYEAKSNISFDEDVLFTHRGLSGPGILQISSYWTPGGHLRLNLLPQHGGVESTHAWLAQAKRHSRKLVSNELASLLPSRLADAWVQQNPGWQRPINEVSDKAIYQLTESLCRWQIRPSGSEGYRKAEVTAGGVETRELSSQTMESQRQAGLYFIGEVSDVTGWLGGYNFQWAWSSGHACAMAMQPSAGSTTG